MDAIEIVAVAVGGVAVVLAAWITFVSGVGTKSFWQNTTDIGVSFGEVLEAANLWVHDAEQLWLTGQLEKNERSAYVIDKMREYMPGLSDEVFVSAINAAVGIAKNVIATSTGKK